MTAPEDARFAELRCQCASCKRLDKRWPWSGFQLCFPFLKGIAK